MPTKEETLAQLEATNQKVNDQEARGLAMIAARDQAISQLQDLITQLQARPEVPQDVTDSIQKIADNLDDNFVAAGAPPAPVTPDNTLPGAQPK